MRFNSRQFVPSIGIAVIACFSSMTIGLTTAQQNSEQTDSDSSSITIEEYDEWRGASLGVNMKWTPEGYVISRIYPHIEDSPLNVGDLVIQIDELKLTRAFFSPLRERLAKSKPGNIMKVVVMRDEKRKVLDVRTYRQQFVDLARLADQISNNRLIKQRLKKLNQSHQLDGLLGKLTKAVKNSKSPRAAYESINQLLDDMDLSHTAFIPKASYDQLMGQNASELGMILRRFTVNGKTGYFVIDIKPGSAAYQSTIRLGDQILYVNGVDINLSKRLVLAGEEQRHNVFTIQTDPDELIRFEFKSSPNGKMQSTKLAARKVISMKEVSLASAKIIERQGIKVGYMRFWNLMSLSVNTALKQQLESEFKNCDALIVDLRGRGGILPTVLALDRTIGKMKIPVVGITDELTRSAKEVLSHRIKKHKHVTVIGERTCGAVTGARTMVLPSGNALMYPVASSETLKQYSDGIALEGVGVKPDIEIPFYEAFCSGNDGLLNSAIDQAVKNATASKPLVK